MGIKSSDILAMGFSAAMYAIDEAALIDQIGAAIAEQEKIVVARVGQAVFDRAENAMAAAQAVKFFTASEMARRRIVHLSANIRTDSAEGAEAKHLEKMIAYWDARAEIWIAKMADGGIEDSGGFATGCTVSASDSRRAISEI